MYLKNKQTCVVLFLSVISGLIFAGNKNSQKSKTYNKIYGGRIKMGKVQPDAHKALNALDVYNSQSGVDKLQREMIKIRASQINGCTYCVNSYSKNAMKLGETPQRFSLPVASE